MPAQLRLSIAPEKEGLYIRIAPETGNEPAANVPAPLTNQELTEILRRISAVSIDGFIMPKRIYSNPNTVAELRFSDIRTFLSNPDGDISSSNNPPRNETFRIRLFRTPEQE